MIIDRREFVILAAATTASTGFGMTSQGETHQMFGMIAKIVAVSGQREALIAILLKSATEMPGCLSYVVAKDSADANTIWITEAWESKSSHDASLSLPSVKQAMVAGKPLIASFAQVALTEPVGGNGLASSEKAR